MKPAVRIRHGRLSSVRRAALGALGITLAATLAATLGGPSLAAVTGPPADDPVPSDSDRVRVVMVDAPTVDQRNEVVALGLDITEHVTKQGIEVVLYDNQDAQTLRDAGFTWDVEVRDLEAKASKQRQADRRYAARVDESPLPSGRTAYRTYPEYLSDMDDLASRYPRLTRPLTLANRSVLGERIHGLEISTGADNIKDGKPVFLLMGAHHAREWPSSEHAMEFGTDLLQSYADGDARARNIMRDSRLVIVPVVNVDGFQISRNAAPLGDFSMFDYEMKRKNCDVSENTPAAYTGGTCATTRPAGSAAPTSTATTPASGAAAARARTGRATPIAATAPAASRRATRCGSSSRSAASR